MSSPSNVVIIITHVPDTKFVRSCAYEAEHEWTRTHPVDSNDRYWYGEQVAHEFLSDMCVGKGATDGAEGTMITWGYNGNHVNIDDVLEAVEIFGHKLIEKFHYTKLTIFHEPSDMCADVYAIDGTQPAPYKVRTTDIRFDVELGLVKRRA